MTIEATVTEHYTTGGLYDRVRSALRELGVDPDNATADDLKACDEFHTGGKAATDALLEFLTVTPNTRVLDIGSGIGGPARLFASRFGCAATGVDLTQEYVETATDLSRMVGLADKTTFLQGSALDLPVEDGSADLALLFHVGMNIEDKATLMRQAYRVLAPGGRFAIFDVMRGPDAASELLFPLPWSSVAETSFVTPPETYKSTAADAGFSLIHERDRTQFTKDFFAEAFRMAAAEGPPKIGIHLMMGATAGDKIQNYVKNVDAGRIGPVEMIFQRPA